MAGLSGTSGGGERVRRREREGGRRGGMKLRGIKLRTPTVKQKNRGKPLCRKKMHKNTPDINDDDSDDGTLAWLVRRG